MRKHGGDSLIQVEDLSKAFSRGSDTLQVLQQISLSAEPGELIAIIGPSGCGKSTFFNILAGLLSPDGGSISLNKEIETHPKRVMAFMKGLTRGIHQTVSDPKASLETFLKLHPDLRDELNRRAYQATLPFFMGSPKQEPSRWVEMQKFMLDRGLIKRVRPVGEMIWIGK